MADKTPSEFQWDNPVIVREDKEAGNPALRNVLNYISALPDSLRRFAQVVEAFTGQGAGVVLRGYAQKSTTAVGAWSKLVTIGPRGRLEGAASGIANATTELASMTFAAQGMRMQGTEYTVICSDVERNPRASIHVLPLLDMRTPETLSFCGTSGSGSAVSIGSSSLTSAAATFDFVVIGQFARLP